VEKDITALARQTGAIVIATGPVDRIGDGERILEVGGGTPMLAKITGSGCMLSAMLGAFMAVDRSAESAAACCAMMKSCGEQADRWTRKAGRWTGTFHMALLDALSLILAH
jgi:hydroxyethylthiazole kinase-like sugar kinase family protein